MRKLFKRLRDAWKDENFLHSLKDVEVLVSKVLSIAMLIVILVAIYDLVVFLVRDFLIAEGLVPEPGSFVNRLFTVFGLFLNVLIALEILENISAYLKKHMIQVELVIVTSLVAVARKIIILDLERKTAMDLIALAIAIFALSVSYWIVRNIASKQNS
ncbi:phosphate-starvation-inducible PsiE family protein [Leptodesmis sichuanensis]|uniref:phosphate-starvation-inducible PsiE family protein n=1 Tax=Leptodesmis sichuanensis TaxID=2906798 RepID=UPI001F424CFD|nr:phosphate-starvation-inducible PsiE family protein [Leptodesmis sichuanensis]